MNKNNFFFILIIIQLGCSNSKSEEKLLYKKNPIGIYGKVLSKGPVYSVDDILTSAESSIGNTLLVSGIIAEVCPMRGCWIQLKDYISDSKIRIKVTDGEIVFPLSSLGKKIIAEGEFRKLELSTKQAKLWKFHLAQERGLDIDTSTITLNENDYYEYRLYSKAAKIF